jgi:hypothetical protein
MLMLLTFFLNILSTPLFSKEDTITTPWDSSYYFVSNCEIFSPKGDLVRTYYGRLCSFMENGSLVTSYKGSLYFHDAQMKTVNSIQKIYPHHQINRTETNELLVMGSEFGKIKNKNVRFDKLFIFSSDGKELKSYSFKENYQNLINRGVISNFLSPFNWDEFCRDQADFEVLHVNSFYRIPKQQNPLNDTYFKDGNYIVNSYSSPYLFIFDKDLKDIIHLLPKSSSDYDYPMLHDVQPTSSGKLIVYNNYINNENKKKRLSRIEIYDSNFKKNLFSYARKKPNTFYSEICGGIQFFEDESFVYSEIRNNKTHINYVQMNHKKNETEIPIKWVRKDTGAQQIKLFKLDSFLKNNKGP